MTPLFMTTREETPINAVTPVEGRHYSYCRASQQALWNANGPTMSTTQTHSGRHSISDDSHSDSE